MQKKYCPEGRDDSNYGNETIFDKKEPTIHSVICKTLQIVGLKFFGRVLISEKRNKRLQRNPVNLSLFLCFYEADLQIA